MSTEKTILVTGGTGFVGSYLLRYLINRGYTRIRAVRRANSLMDLVQPIQHQVQWLEGDLLDIFFLEEALEGVDQVYHSAAVVSFDPRDAKHMMQVNVEGTANLVNAALAAGIEKMVHVSSVATLGRVRNGETLSERSIWQRSRFVSNYAISKFLAEQEVWRGIAEGLKAAIVNPSIILGSGRWSDGPLRFFSLIWNNFPFYSTGGTGFVDVRDVARFIILLMESDIEGQRYVLNGENLSYAELLRRIAGHLQRRPPYIKVTPIVQELVWRLSWLQSRLGGKRPFITRETARNSGQTFYFDSEKSRSVFDFQYTPMEETLALASRQFQESSNSGFSTQLMPLLPF